MSRVCPNVSVALAVELAAITERRRSPASSTVHGRRRTSSPPGHDRHRDAGGIVARMKQLARGLLVVSLGGWLVAGCDDTSTQSNAAAAKSASDNKADAKATDAKATDAKATDAKATDAKATDAKATDATATDTKATDTKAPPVDAKATPETPPPAVTPPPADTTKAAATPAAKTTPQLKALDDTLAAVLAITDEDAREKAACKAAEKIRKQIADVGRNPPAGVDATKWLEVSEVMGGGMDDFSIECAEDGGGNMKAITTVTKTRKDFDAMLPK
jgi:hypothetical protein